MTFCKGFHPLCNFCDHMDTCPKFTTQELGELEELKSQKAKLVKDIAIQEDQVKDFYVNSSVSGDWLSTGDYRFRCSETSGRKSLDSKALTAERVNILGEDEVEKLVQKFTTQGSPSQRLYISKTKAVQEN